jgi:hypothetical protein
MSSLTQTKPISYLNLNAAKIAQDLKEDGGTLCDNPKWQACHGGAIST